MTLPYVDDIIRTFYALKVTPDLVNAVRRIQGRARIDLPRGLRWTRPEQAHLTLAFLGDVPNERIEELKQILLETASASQSFTVDVHGIGGFPRAQRPRVVWAGVSGVETPEFEKMHQLLWQKLEPIKPKPKPEDRPFHPHITLARVPGPQPAKIAEWMEKHAGWHFGVWQVAEMQLIQSVLTPKGPVYETLATAELKPLP